MPNLLNVDETRKLAVTYRVEAGCLGPDGLNYIADFCLFAQAELQMPDYDYIAWRIIHRADKTLPEIEYNLVGKAINTEKVEKYLSVFGKTLDDFESHISDKLEDLIGQFMSHQ